MSSAWIIIQYLWFVWAVQNSELDSHPCDAQSHLDYWLKLFQWPDPIHYMVFNTTFSWCRYDNVRKITQLSTTTMLIISSPLPYKRLHAHKGPPCLPNLDHVRTFIMALSKRITRACKRQWGGKRVRVLYKAWVEIVAFLWMRYYIFVILLSFIILVGDKLFGRVHWRT